MRKNKQESNNRVGSRKIDTLIGKDSTFTGNIESTGTIRIDGKFEGEIVTKGDLVIGESGAVQGKIKAENIIIAGKVQGEVEAAGKLELVPTGNLQGRRKWLSGGRRRCGLPRNCQQYSKDSKKRASFYRLVRRPNQKDNRPENRTSVKPQAMLDWAE